MSKYIVKRVAMGIFSVFIVASLTFFIMNLVPGGPFVAEKSISKAAQQALAEKYGLDKPLGVQYLNYMNSLIHGDMGLSLKQRGRTVNQIIFSKLPVSARTAGLAVLVALCVGIPLGVRANGYNGVHKGVKLCCKLRAAFLQRHGSPPPFYLQFDYSIPGRKVNRR